MNEADYKRKLVAEVNALRGAYARRLEDRFAVGVLDLIIKLPERPWVWAEGKLINGNLFAPTERQWVEGERIRATGTPVLLIGWKGRSMSISPWVKQADWRNCLTASNGVSTLMEYLYESRRQPA